MASSTAPLETVEELGTDDAAVAQRWITEINLFEKGRTKFEKRAKKIINRYRDERETKDTNSRKMNLLWANTEVLKPTVYAQTPKASVQRRFKDSDPVGRVASMILERAVDYFLSCDVSRFDSVMRLCRDDYLLVGQAVAWQRYVPHFRDVQLQASGQEVAEEGQQLDTEQDDASTESPAMEAQEAYQELEYEEVVDDYVYWQDFGFNSGARTWEEVYAVWRKAYLTRDELRERFPEVADRIPLDAEPEGLDDKSKINELFKKATVYEIWDKASKKAYWVHRQFPERPLDVKDDPLHLENFFPCPKPMFASINSGSLVPIPDYAQYQDQAEEVDSLTSRISHLTKALKVRGLYAGELSEIKRLFQDGDEGDLIPVENWAMFAEKGGLQNAISWVPLRDIADTLMRLYEARDKAKADLYEVTGLSDILRGASNANETATAQAIKAQWGGTRVKDKQQEMARFSRDTIRIKAEIIAEHFSPDTILKIANAEGIPELMMTVQAPVMGPNGMPVIDPQTGQPQMQPQKQFNQQLAMQALELLRSDALRNWRVDIESDSTIAADEQADKQSRTEFIQAVSQFVESWGPIIQGNPHMAPLAGEMLKFAVRGFKIGESLETVIEQTVDQITQAASQPPAPPQPDPNEQMKAEAEKTRAQADVQKAHLELVKTGVDTQGSIVQQENQMRHAAMQAALNPFPGAL